MNAKLIIPIEALHGKLNARDDYYFRTINGRQYAQRCPKRTKRPTAAQTTARATFAERSRLVAQLQLQGSTLSKKELWTIVSKDLN